MSNLWQQKRLQIAAKAAAKDGIILRHQRGTEPITLMLRQHQRDLKRIQSFERKAEFKQKILPRYTPWVEEVLAQQSGVLDDVLMFVMLWRIDSGDYDGALTIAEYALTHRLKIPGQQSRTTGCAVAEEIADAASHRYAVKKPLPLAILQRTMDLTIAEDMPDKVRAQLYKWLGYSQRDNQQPQQALVSLIRALALDKNVGVKSEIKQLAKSLPSQA